MKPSSYGGHMDRRLDHKLIALLISFSLLAGVVLSSCDIGSKHLEKNYDENNNESLSYWDDVDDANVITWDNANIQTFEDVDVLSEWAYSTLLFDDYSEDFPVVDVVVLDYRANGSYFDGELIYELVNDEFDVNTFVSQYAVGTGVIVVCIILHVATAGASTPVMCFFAGAADASISYAIKGAALGAAIGAVTTAIETEGDWEAAMYGALEAGAEGYMWGAIWGAATGGFASEYCFTEDTLVQTDSALKPICDIQPGDLVLSYNEVTEAFEYESVEYISTNEVTSTIKVVTSEDSYESTRGHPYLTDRGWVEAAELSIGDYILSVDGWILVEDLIATEYDEPITTYNFSVSNTHTYVIGTENIVVHNRCNARDETRYFREGTPQAEKYPEGVYFDSNGYPRFEPYIVDDASVTVDFGVLNGNYTHDAAIANEMMGYPDTPSGCVWHHVEDGQTLILLPQDLHSVRFGGMAHNGGASVIRTTVADGTEILSSAV